MRHPDSTGVARNQGRYTKLEKDCRSRRIGDLCQSSAMLRRHVSSLTLPSRPASLWHFLVVLSVFGLVNEAVVPQLVVEEFLQLHGTVVVLRLRRVVRLQKKPTCNF
jgi:hypothetical protein